MTKPIGIQKDQTITDAIKKIQEKKISRILIYDGKKPIGIVSEKDILSYLYYGKKHSKSKVPINKIMNKIYFCDKSSSVNQAAQFMIEKNCSSVAVGTKSKFEGMVTKSDITKFFAQNKPKLYQVRDQMSIHYFSVFTKDSLFDVIKTMLGFGISRMIIVNDKKKPVGIVSTGDIFRAFLRVDQSNQPKKSLEQKLDEEIWSKDGTVGSVPAGKIMHKGIIRIGMNDDLSKACQLMIRERINAVGVEDTKKQLVGVLGKRDILLALRQEIT